MNISTLILQVIVLASVFYNAPEVLPISASGSNSGPTLTEVAQPGLFSEIISDFSRPDLALCGVLFLVGGQMRRRNRIKDVTS